VPEAYSWSVEQLAKDTLGLMDKLGIQKVHWIGEASGGIMGILFAASYPDRVSSLILCDTPLKFGDKQFSDLSLGQEDPGAAVEKLGFKEWCVQTIGQRIDKSKADPKLVQWVASEMIKTPEHVAKALIRIFAKVDVSPLLSKIKVPILVLASSKRSSDWLNHLRVMKEHWPRAHFEVFDDVGPGLHLLIPDRCTNAVLKFLEKIA
jgi:pimeloyl-ACP methyl ester carboxylesterase